MGDPSTQPTWNCCPPPAPTHSIKLWFRGHFGLPPVGDDTSPPNLAFSDSTGKKGTKTALQFNFENLGISRETAQNTKARTVPTCGLPGAPQEAPWNRTCVSTPAGPDHIILLDSQHKVPVQGQEPPFPFTEEERWAQRRHDLPRTPERVGSHWDQPPSSPSRVQSLSSTLAHLPGAQLRSESLSTLSPVSGPKIVVDKLEGMS